MDKVARTKAATNQNRVRSRNLAGKSNLGRSLSHPEPVPDFDFIYNSWDAFSEGIADKIRSSSIRIETGFPAIAEKDERSPLITRGVEEGRKSKIGEISEEISREETSLSGDKSGEYSSPRNGISWFSVAFGLANASIGVGILNYPFIYNRAGGIEISSITQIALIGCLFLSMSIIIYCSDLHNSCSYHEVLSSICGPKARILVAVDIAVATYGICIAYLVIIGDQYDRIFASLVGDNFCTYWYLDRRFTIALTGLAIYPICLLKRLDFLRHTGPLGIFSMLYIVFLTVYQYYQLGPQQPMAPLVPQELNSRAMSLLSCIPVILFGYQCNEVIVPIYASLKERNFKNFLKASLLAYSVLLILYCTVGTFGLMTFGATVAPNVMMMFNANDPLVLIGICALIFKMVVTYPQMAFAGREAYLGIAKTLSTKSNLDFDSNEVSRRIKSTTFWFLTSLLISAFAPHIGIVLQLLGTLATCNVFICPALCLIFLSINPARGYSPRVKIGMIITAIILIILGIIFFVFVLWQAYLDINLAIKSGSSSLCKI